MSGTFPQEVIDAAVAAGQGVPPSATLAQWAVESGWGAHVPLGSNNPFGIKAFHGEPSVSVLTHEWSAASGRYVTITALFKAYPTLAAAFVDHATILATEDRYAFARALLPDVRAFVRAVASIYATSPTYGDLLVKIIDEHDLTQYDD